MKRLSSAEIPLPWDWKGTATMATAANVGKG